MKDVKKAYDFLMNSGMYYLATATKNGEPHVRIFTSCAIVEGSLYIQTSNQKEVYRQLEENDRFEICAFSKGSWIRITGHAVRKNTTAARKAVLDAQPELRSVYHYDENDGKCEVFALEGEAVISSFTSAPESFEI